MTEAEMRERLQLLRRNLKESEAYLEQFRPHEAQLKAANPDGWPEIERVHNVIKQEIVELESRLSES